MKKNKKGFTLVELLAVVVILGVLLIIAVPAITRVQKQAKQRSAKDGALMLVKAIETCSAISDSNSCAPGELDAYYEGTLSETECTNSDNDCAYYTYDATNKKYKVIYNLSGYGISITKDTISEIKKGISNFDYNSISGNNTPIN